MLRLGWVIALLGMGMSTAFAAEPWAQWRGPEGDGRVTDTVPPLEVTAANIVWKSTLPGRGQSSPVIWDDRIFLTSYEGNGAKRIVFACDRVNGKVLWQQTAWTGSPEPSHQMNGWASATCATDGERVYAFFGKGGGLFCYSRDGKKVWDLPLGDFAGPWGTASCPMLSGSTLVQNCDAEENARLIGVDKLSGKILWSTPRENYRGWSTPFLTTVGNQPQAVINGQNGIRSYDPNTGKELWFCAGFAGRGEPSVVPDATGRLFAVNGLAGDVYSIQPDGRGDVTATHRKWHTPRKSGRDLPSPVVVGEQLLVMAMKGILTGYDTKSGAVLWEERVGGNYSASPVVVRDRAVFVSEAGELVVVHPTADQKIAGRYAIGAPENEIFRSSLAAHDGQWLLRSDQTLYCLGAAK